MMIILNKDNIALSVNEIEIYINNRIVYRGEDRKRQKLVLQGLEHRTLEVSQGNSFLQGLEHRTLEVSQGNSFLQGLEHKKT